MVLRESGRRHIAWFDVHVPHNTVLREPLAFAHDTGCEDFILGGDFLNLEWASHWNERLFKEIGTLAIRKMLFQELEAGEKVVADIRRAIGRRARFWYLPGNHEAWLWYACFNHRVVDTPFDPDVLRYKSDLAKLLKTGLRDLLARLLNAKKYDMTVLPYEEPLKLGRIVYFHGHQFGGRNPTETSAKRWPSSNVVFGHHHTHLVNTIFNLGDPRQVNQHVAVPALCGLCPFYLRDPSTRWLNGFWVCDFKDGLFDGRVVKVMDGKIIRRGA